MTLLFPKIRHFRKTTLYGTGLVNVATSAVLSKYKTAWALTLFIISHVIGTGATLYWDLFNDWGFFRPGEDFPLRKQKVLDHDLIYYLAILQDIVLRLAWTVPLILKWQYHLGSAVAITDGEMILMETVFVVAELWRRGIWNFFRLENEHLNNTGEFRVMRNIRVSSEKKDHFKDLVRIMNFKDGCVDMKLMNRKKRPETKKIN